MARLCAYDLVCPSNPEVSRTRRKRGNPGRGLVLRTRVLGMGEEHGSVALSVDVRVSGEVSGDTEAGDTRCSS
jgi:hypothetical protein